MAVTESMLVAIGGVITIGAAALATVIAQLEKSRCTEIDCLCCKCKRRPLDSEEDEAVPEPEPEPEPEPARRGPVVGR